MLNLSEVKLRISHGLITLNVLRQQRERLKGQIADCEHDLTNLREREAELERDGYNEALRKAGHVNRASGSGVGDSTEAQDK